MVRFSPHCTTWMVVPWHSEDIPGAANAGQDTALSRVTTRNVIPTLRLHLSILQPPRQFASAGPVICRRANTEALRSRRHTFQ